MTTKRIDILSKILKEAQETVGQPDQMDQSTADKIAEDIFNKIFDEEVKKLISQTS